MPFDPYSSASIISSYLKEQDELFTSEEFFHYLKKSGIKITKAECVELLRSSDYVFSLVNDEYITKAGVFIGRWFSFKPSKEEVNKGSFLIGHRCMPFANSEIPCDSLIVINQGKEIPSSSTVFSMNLAMDVFALYGEGYIIPNIFGDKSNDSLSISSMQYSLPSEIKLTSWPLKSISGKRNFKYGDRILCRVVDWANGVIEMLHMPDSSENFTLSEEKLEREQWYSDFENSFLASMQKHGPVDSIEEQLSLLFLENQEELCKKNCGSVEEFLAHTTKIGFSSYGVENRIWKNGEDVPFLGPWNKNFSNDLIFLDMTVSFSPYIIDAFIEDYIYQKQSGKKMKSFEDLLEDMLPQILRLSSTEKKFVLLNIKKRHDIVEKSYNNFSNFTIAKTRHRCLALFTRVNSLMSEIACSDYSISLENLPQQEVIILTQLFGHLVRLLEELENNFTRNQFPIDDVELSLDGMEETFDDIEGSLTYALENNKRKGFEIVSD
ncbi:MAG: hypothetical protein PUC37_07945 [Spirochaetales bacterium]|nr:hypothetical protein [Spirochaetales bacterium]